MINFTSKNWPANAPEYWSLEGYEYQKMLARKSLIAEASTIPYLLSKAEAAHKAQDYLTESRYLTVAWRLAGITNYRHKHLIAAMVTTVTAVVDAMDANSRQVGNYEPRKRFNLDPKRKMIASIFWN